MAAGSGALPRGSSTICLPISKEDYEPTVASAAGFRAWLDRALGQSPELFLQAFASGYELKDSRFSKKLGVVAEGCCLGSERAQQADAEALTGPTGCSSRRPRTSSRATPPGR